MNRRFSQRNEDACRLPEGMRRIAYDADSQRYTFRDRSGQLYQSAPGDEYGVLKPVATPLSHRRNVTITEIVDPALREHQRLRSSAKTFDDILPSGYITAAARSDVESPSGSSFSLVQAAIPKAQGVVEIVRRRTTMRRPARWVSRNESISDEKKGLLEDSSWEVVHKEDTMDGRVARSKSEVWAPRYLSRK